MGTITFPETVNLVGGTAEGAVVIFEGSSTDDSHKWQRSADTAGGCTAGHFTLTNKASGFLLTKILDTGNLLTCAASSTVDACKDVNKGESLIAYFMLFRYSRVSNKRTLCALIRSSAFILFF